MLTHFEVTASQFAPNQHGLTLSAPRSGKRVDYEEGEGVHGWILRQALREVRVRMHSRGGRDAEPRRKVVATHSRPSGTAAPAAVWDSRTRGGVGQPLSRRCGIAADRGALWEGLSFQRAEDPGQVVQLMPGAGCGVGAGQVVVHGLDVV